MFSFNSVQHPTHYMHFVSEPFISSLDIFKHNYLTTWKFAVFEAAFLKQVRIASFLNIVRSSIDETDLSLLFLLERESLLYRTFMLF